MLARAPRVSGPAFSGHMSSGRKLLVEEAAAGVSNLSALCCCRDALVATMRGVRRHPTVLEWGAVCGRRDRELWRYQGLY
ncbi:hypothetical protein chiPu_0006629 [Chiloscyllium punctatum]|uniref:Uncharacterized protein n=1 Tax=Chiloscyllium punctatum TaxID=137246 RepID=A0A401SCT5_CHIPU|nr:hypothetical protein [Chiloscyllium punctatum]